MNNLVCTWCKREMTYLHGDGACINNQCPMFGLNQAECCDGETAVSYTHLTLPTTPYV